MSDQEQEAGDPGRTPGSAEGDRETVEQDLAQKQQDKNNVSPNQENKEQSEKIKSGDDSR